jgi:hypothetical protein
MNALDEHNLREQTKGGQPATAVGVSAPHELVRQLNPHATLKRTIDTRTETMRATLSQERRQVARDVAQALGYRPADMARYADAAEKAVLAGFPMNMTAGRVSIGRREVSPAQTSDPRYVLSIVGPTGALYDPTRPSDPGNNLWGSD